MITFFRKKDLAKKKETFAKESTKNLSWEERFGKEDKNKRRDKKIMEEQKRGKIITIEGGDGTGKKTQTDLLVAKLREQGHVVETMDFPQYETPTGKMVKTYLEGKLGTIKDVPWKAATAFFATDRLAAQEKIKKWLNEGKLVVLNRYIESNLGHQAAKVPESERVQIMEWIYNFEVSHLGSLPSDIVVLLTLPLETADEAVTARGNEKDIYEQDKEYLKEVHKTYSVAAEIYNWSVVNCMDEQEKRRSTKEEVAGKVWAAVSSKI